VGSQGSRGFKSHLLRHVFDGALHPDRRHDVIARLDSYGLVVSLVRWTLVVWAWKRLWSTRRSGAWHRRVTACSREKTPSGRAPPRVSSPTALRRAAGYACIEASTRSPGFLRRGDAPSARPVSRPGAVRSPRIAALRVSGDYRASRGSQSRRVTVLKGRAPRNLGGVIVHETRRLPRVDVARIDGIAVTSIARTLIDCSALWKQAVLEEALDDAVRTGLLSLPRLRWRMREIGGPGRMGSRTLRVILDARSGGESLPGSVLERRLLRLVVRARLPAPERQHQIREAGRLLAVVDFAYPKARLAIEADGYAYHSGRVRWQRDLIRRDALSSRGWRVIHVTAEDIALRGPETCRAIARALAQADSTSD
jgi:very-short-patch-repair endonuclease